MAVNRRRGYGGVAVSATVFMPMANGDSIARRVLFDVTTNTIVRNALLASACAGYAFLNDPVTKTGSFALRPDTCADHLDPLRDPVSLDDLAHAGGGRRRLAGPRVKVRAPAALGKQYDPPVQAPPFAFSSRTNEFAAVSAYYHCNSMMQLIKEFGFSLQDIFADVVLPLTVDHRAKMLAGSGTRDGRGINAYVTPFLGKYPQRPWNVKMLFGLADFEDTWKHPLGLVADVRFVWHEFCHVLILSATGSTEFDFAHSAGDALAAIMGDPASKLPEDWRGVTFPFVRWRCGDTIARSRRVLAGTVRCMRFRTRLTGRAIRPVTTPNRYCRARCSVSIVPPAAMRFAEQTGAEEPDVEVRRAAAYRTAYLIVRAIASLGYVQTEPTREAAQLPPR